MRGRLIDYSKGDDLHRYWKLFRRRREQKIRGDAGFSDLLSQPHGPSSRRVYRKRSADPWIPSLPHGLHGVYISRYASIGEGCRIYQNVTIGEVEHVAPSIGRLPDRGRSRDHRRRYRRESRKDWSGAVVSFDVPDDATVVAQPPLIYRKEATPDDDVS